jgi:hypothetical protein
MFGGWRDKMSRIEKVMKELSDLRTFYLALKSRKRPQAAIAKQISNC